MEFIPVTFRVDRCSTLPILRITGVTRLIPGIERALITQALELMEYLKKFKGKVMELNESDNLEDLPEDNAGVRFFVIFPNDEEASKAMAGIKEELG